MSNNPVVAEILKRAQRVEDKTVPGAPLRGTKQQLLDASDVAEKYKDDLHVRWVNTRDPQKATGRQLDGYVKLTKEEGGRSLGDETALFAQPIARYRENVEAIDKLNKDRMKSHTREMEETVQAVVRELRDKHGLHIDERRLFVNEGE